MQPCSRKLQTNGLIRMKISLPKLWRLQTARLGGSAEPAVMNGIRLSPHAPTECNVEEEVVQSLDIERVRAALKALTPEERDIIMNFYFSENPLSGEALAEKFAKTKSSIYRRRDHALRKLKSILGNA